MYKVLFTLSFLILLSTLSFGQKKEDINSKTSSKSTSIFLQKKNIPINTNNTNKEKSKEKATEKKLNNTSQEIKITKESVSKEFKTIQFDFNENTNKIDLNSLKRIPTSTDDDLLFQKELSRIIYYYKDDFYKENTAVDFKTNNKDLIPNIRNSNKSKTVIRYNVKTREKTIQKTDITTESE